jgi:hydroxymethylbilane synthase
VTDLLKDTHFKILPLSLFPTAPAQGALAVEFFNDQSEKSQHIQKMLHVIHDDFTAKNVQLEKTYFQKYGGGCHLAIGIHVQMHAQSNLQLVHINGQVDQQEIQEFTFYPPINTLIDPNQLFVGLPKNHSISFLQNSNILFDEIHEKFFYHFIPGSNPVYEKDWVFLTSKNCHHFVKELSLKKNIWVSGPKSHQQLSQESSCWISGDNDSLGESMIHQLIQSEFWHCWNQSNGNRETPTLHVCTGDSAKVILGNKISCYGHHEKNPVDGFLKEFQKRTFFYWLSPTQFESYKHYLPKNAIHFVGPGKTYDHLINQTKNQIYILPRMNDFKDLIVAH